MVLFPNCKINLGLNIIRKREDGYHDIETVFYPLGLKDALEGIKSGAGSAIGGMESGVQFSSSGLEIKGNPADNLCVKAWQLLKKDFPDLHGMQIHLHKAIPMGAGLGGGSADGAFSLLLINELCNLNLSLDQLIHYALQLGSDCPFFILNKPCFATGRGEKMQAIKLDLSQYKFVIINPNIHISTATAFAEIKPGKPARSIDEIIQLPVAEWKEWLLNDFEKTVSILHPEIELIKQEFYKKGALYASMTGSGSTVYGIFEKNTNPKPSLNPAWPIHII